MICEIDTDTFSVAEQGMQFRNRVAEAVQSATDAYSPIRLRGTPPNY